MTRYTAAHQWNILTDDPIAGLSPVPGSRPRARKYGTCVTTDSHMVNKLTLKHLRMEMPAEEPLLCAPCLQHHTGTTATEISHFLDIPPMSANSINLWNGKSARGRPPPPPPPPPPSPPMERYSITLVLMASPGGGSVFPGG